MNTRGQNFARWAFRCALAAQFVPLGYAFYQIGHLTPYRAPLILEFRLATLIMGLAAAGLGWAALRSRPGRRRKAIAAIVLGLSAVLWHVVICGGSDPFQNTVCFCPMRWGVVIP